MVQLMTQDVLDRKIAMRIRNRLRERGMSQAALARQMDMGVDALSRRMRGKSRFKWAEVKTAAAILQMKPGELLDEGEDQ